MTEVAFKDDGEKQQEVRTIRWVGLVGGDTGASIDVSHYPDKTIQVIGSTFDGAVTILGSNDGTNYEILTNQLDLPLSFTAKGIKLVLENTKWIKPAVAAGTSLNTIILTCARS
jgi:hypothetical protein